MRTQSYLVRDQTPGTIALPISRFMEYFVACHMIDLLGDTSRDLQTVLNMWKSHPITLRCTIRSISGGDTVTLWRIIEYTRAEHLMKLAMQGAMH